MAPILVAFLPFSGVLPSQVGGRGDSVPWCFAVVYTPSPLAPRTPVSGKGTRILGPGHPNIGKGSQADPTRFARRRSAPWNFPPRRSAPLRFGSTSRWS